MRRTAETAPGEPKAPVFYAYSKRRWWLFAGSLAAALSVGAGFAATAVASLAQVRASGPGAQAVSAQPTAAVQTPALQAGQVVPQAQVLRHDPRRILR